MRVLVTGAAGRIGQYTAAELLAHGHEVVGTDLRRAPLYRDLPEDALAGMVWRESDAADVAAVTWAMRDCDAVVHMGAIPAPRTNPDHVVWRNNVMGVWSVFQAAETVGITRVVQASSVSAYGPAWSDIPRPMRYVPADEAHPMENADPYGLSKEVAELVGATFNRRTGMQVVSMRYSWVGSPSEIGTRRPSTDEELRGNGKNLWAGVDARDAARANRMALETEDVGCVALNITGRDNVTDLPTMDLIRRYLPDIEIRREISGFRTAFDISAAREAIGWEPIHHWHPDE
ncbi:MAG TPA: NAD(P)-dependent oxidoreductase [Thermomicrobiales bacterium]|jgi:nucleoside-diphosphate-sugar epimerase|nr:NAD(P)-dependent oxidoreductase [Thermomicrobiales bacterium]